MPIDEHRQLNWLNWEDRVPVHTTSTDYGFERFRDDPTHLSGVVARDVDTLGSLDGLDVVHLQCHIGTDTVSLARLGAASTTGYDFSPSALGAARRLATDAGNPVEFVEGELYDAPERLGTERFDLVYTGTGALCWLPDVAGWARVAASLLRPGGRLFMREGHPVLWTIDHERDDDLVVIRFPYFETSEPITLDEGPQTYTDGDTSAMTNTKTAEWNHGLGEVVQAVLDAGLVLTGLVEERECAWSAVDRLMEGDHERWFRMREGGERLPLMYTLDARKPRTS
ncbi:MAG TPA: class I SAM-dependent methyltransferase [Acidimicrobiia bacterium]|jgi:SAM-dependent methyltransferase